MDVWSSTMIGSLRQPTTKGLASFAAWAYELVDALGRCWLLLLATLSVAVAIAFVTSTLGALLVTLFASQILESRREDEIARSPLRGHACFAVPGMLGLLAAFLVPLPLAHVVGGSPFLLPHRRRELPQLGILFQTMVMPASSWRGARRCWPTSPVLGRSTVASCSAASAWSLSSCSACCSPPRRS